MTTQEMFDVLIKTYAAYPKALSVGIPRLMPLGGISFEVCTNSASCSYLWCFHIFGTDEMLRDTEAILLSKYSYLDRKFFLKSKFKAASKGHRLFRLTAHKLFPLEAECANRFQDFAKWRQYNSVWFLNESGKIFFPRTLGPH